MRLILQLVIASFVALLLLFLSFLTVNFYERHRLNERMEYWTVQVQHRLPPGTPLPDAQNFFQSHGIPLKCTSSPDGSQTCRGWDIKQYGSLPTWHIRFDLEFSNNALVSSEHIALGVGL